MNDSPWVHGGRSQGRGHRMGTWQRDRDEDLALFHDMRARERKNFLHPSYDDIDSSLSAKSGAFPDYRVSSSTPTRHGTGDLLVSDLGKSDYDWLLTPPGTPLFPSLDQDVPIVNLSQRGALTRAASASKSSRLSYPQEPTSKVLRGNPSPRRPSTPSSASSTASTTRARPSSPSITSSSPTLQPSTPSGRPSTPSRRASATASRTTSRSSTPTLRRTNTSPTSCPSKAGSVNLRNRGKSLSPKSRPWESSMPGFSSEVPPNLRTSLSDRTTQRGGTLVSRHGASAGTRNSYMEASESNQPCQRATSPDISRSWSLSNSQDHSRASVISSCDDDMDIAESVESFSTRASSDNMLKTVKIPSRYEDPSVGRCILPAKRQTRSTATNSADTTSLMNLMNKRSFERQVDQRRSRNMFRPLLSSVPASSFYSTKPAGMHYSPHPRSESSITMTSNGSSEWGAKIVPEIENSHGDEEEKESAREGGSSLETSSDRVVDDEQMTPDLAGNFINQNQYSTITRQELINSRVVKDSSIEEVLKEQVQSGDKTGETKHRTEAFNGHHQVRVDNLEKQGHMNDELQFLSCQRQNADAVGEARGLQIQNPGHHTSSIQHCEIHVQATQSVCPMEQGDVHVEDAVRQESVIHSLHERHKSTGLEDGKCAMDIDTKSLNKQGMGYFGEQHVQEQHKYVRSRGHSPQCSASSSCNNRNEICTLTSPECFVDVSESAFVSGSRPLETSAVDGLSNKILINERPASIGKNMSMERKDMLKDVTLADVVDFPEMNSNLPSAASTCDIQSDAMCQLLRLPGELAPEVLVKCASEQSAELMAGNDVLSGEVHKKKLSYNSADSFGQGDVLSLIGLCATEMVSEEQLHVANPGTTPHQGGDTDEAALTHSRNTTGKDDELYENPMSVEGVVEDNRLLDDVPKNQQPGIPLLRRNVTLEEATETILFCNSIVHGIVYKAAEMGIKREAEEAEERRAKREPTKLLGPWEREKGVAGWAGEGRQRSTSLRRTFRNVQKQRMVQQKTAVVTLRHSPMDRVENAVMGNQEAEELTEQTPETVARQKKLRKQRRKVKSRCSCSVM